TPAVDGATAAMLARADATGRLDTRPIDASQIVDAPALTIVPGDAPRLAWTMSLALASGASRTVVSYIVDAPTGAIVDARDAGAADTATGRGELFYTTRGAAPSIVSFEVTPAAQGWCMSRPAGPGQTELLAKTLDAACVTSSRLNPWDALYPNPGSDIDAY